MSLTVLWLLTSCAQGRPDPRQAPGDAGPSTDAPPDDSADAAPHDASQLLDAGEMDSAVPPGSLDGSFPGDVTMPPDGSTRDSGPGAVADAGTPCRYVESLRDRKSVV
jgi:hypothetical protein